MTYTIRFNRNKCIGAAACVRADPKHWKLAQDKKADLIEGKQEDNTWTREITDEELAKAKEAALMCPVQAIKIFKNGKRL